MPQFEITREIGIDAGHRIPDHGSKCKSLHGHRYRILATCQGDLVAGGEETGMVMDFGFLKEEMMNEIDAQCDHGLMLFVEDPFLPDMIGKMGLNTIRAALRGSKHHGFRLTDGGRFGKLYIMDSVPTAENLAKHWFDRLALKVFIRTEARAKLIELTVWETPNCYATYRGDEDAE